MMIRHFSAGVAAVAMLSLSGFAQAGPEDTVDGPFRFAGRTQVDGAFEGVTSGDNAYDPVVDWTSSMPEGFRGTRECFVSVGNDYLRR